MVFHNGAPLLLAMLVSIVVLAGSAAMGRPEPAQLPSGGAAPAHDADWTLSFSGALGKSSSLTILLASRDGQWKRAICHPGDYNNETHEVDVSALRLDGDRASGTVKVALRPDAWVPKDHKAVVCELTLDARATGGRLAGAYTGTCGGTAVKGAVSGMLSSPVAFKKQALAHLRFEKAVAGVANHMARALLDVEWAEGIPRAARIRCAYPWGWAGRAQAIEGRLAEGALELDLRTLIGMQPGGSGIGADRCVYALRGTVVGSCVSGRFTATIDGQKPRAGRFKGMIDAGGVLEPTSADDRASAITRPGQAVGIDARTATGGELVVPWRTIALDGFRGGLYAVGDLDGDGKAELVTARDGVTGLLAYRLDGSVLWRWGSETPGAPMSSDIPVQVWDMQGKGHDDVYVGVRGFLLVLDGKTGKEIRRWPLPGGLEWADCITFANFRGLDRPRDVIVKTRHGPIWAYTDDWRPLWKWRPPAGYQACHHPTPVDVDGDGKDELIAGWSLLGPDGKERWTMKSGVSDLRKGHCDSSAAVRLGKSVDDALLTICYDTANGLALLDGNGKARWEVGGSHFQLLMAGKMRDDVPGAQVVSLIAYGRNDPTWILGQDGRLLVEIIRAGAWNKLMDWDGDGLLDLISSSGKVFNGKGQCIAELGLKQEGTRETGVRAVPANAVMIADVDGDGRPEAILFSWFGEPTGSPASTGAPRIRIYKSDRTPKSAAAPRRSFNFTLYN